MFTPIILSTGYAGFQAFKQSENAQREALSQTAEVVNETDYAREQLGKVTSAQELVADRRLLEIALTAYGLESEIDKTALIERALEEGTGDDNAFANLLSDSRWVDFSADFGFGDVNSGSNMTAFKAAVQTRFRDAETTSEPAVDAFEISHFRANIGSITSVDELIDDEITLKVALAAFGLERGYYSDEHFRQLLTEGVDDPINDYAYGLEDGDWVLFAAAFTGLADGQPAQTVTSFRMDVERELARREVPLYDDAVADASSSKISATDLLHFQSNADSMTTGAALVADAQLKEVTLSAYGLAETSLSDTEIAAILDGAIAGDFSLAAAQSDTAWKQLATSFAASVNGGAASDVSNFEYAIEIGLAEQKLETIYYLETNTTPTDYVSDADLDYFYANIEDVDGVDGLLADTRLRDVALAAFGLSNEGKSDDYIRTILEEDPSDDDAFVNQLSDTRWADFSKAFNGVNSQATIWRVEIEERLIERGAPDEDLAYLREKWGTIEENLDFILDPDLMDIVLSAFDIDKGTTSTEFFASMVISNPNDDRSLVSLYNDDRWSALVDLMGSFSNVGGNTGDAAFQQELIEKYEAKRFEIAVGEQDQSMRLALNFERLIDEFTEKDNWFLLLGDQPMRLVLDAAFNMPSGFINLDIEEQNEAYGDAARQILGGDTPEVFKDPDKVTEILRRFLVNEASSSGPNPSTPGYGALTIMQNAAANARLFNGNF